MNILSKKNMEIKKSILMSNIDDDVWIAIYDNKILMWIIKKEVVWRQIIIELNFFLGGKSKIEKLIIVVNVKFFWWVEIIT